MSEVPYSYVVLRYVHDPVTEEFVNIGIVMVAPELGYVNAKINESIQRMTMAFGASNFDGNTYKKLIHFISRNIFEWKQKLASGLPLAEFRIDDATQLLNRFFKMDSSAMQVSDQKGGLTSNPDETLERLYERFVSRYLPNKRRKTRSDEDVLRFFKCQFEEHGVWNYLHPHTLSAPHEEYDFPKAWQNEVWHVYDAVSLDLKEPSSVKDKARKWVAILTQLNESKEKFTAHLLIGRPSQCDNSIQKALDQAYSQLRGLEARGLVDLVDESQAEAFAKKVAQEMEYHRTHAN